MARRSAREIALGCSYYPPHHNPEDWERDFKRMAVAGFNALRTAELLASWDSLERLPRQPDFSWLDRTFELAERYGMKILVGTGACCPPIWMLDEYPDLQVVSRDGVPYPSGGTWAWACFDNPGFMKESDRYLRQLVDRYRDHPALLGWQIHNEPGYPFIPPQGQMMQWYCYCDHTAAKFRDWLKAKYGFLEVLNRAWRWDPTHHQYASWEQVRLPRVTPIEWGVLTAWLDWRTFCTDNWAWFIGHQAAFIRERDPDHPVTTNIYGEATDFTGRLGIDPWKLAAVVDAIGYDLYPGLRKRGVPERKREPGGPGIVSWVLDFGRSTALHAGKMFWLPEMESGPLDGWVKGPRYTTKALDIKRWFLEAIGHGAKMILYQGYREWNCIPIHWGALVDLNGEPTERYHTAAQMTAWVRDNEAWLYDAEPVRAEVGIIYGHDNVLVNASLAAEDFAKRSLFGVHEALWAAHYPVEFVTADYLAEPSYRVLFLPFAMVVSDDLAGKLRRFVERGGTLVGFAKCGFLNGQGWYWNDQPGGGLDTVFGVRQRSLEYRPDPFSLRVSLGGATLELEGFHHQQILETAADAEVLGTFHDGTPSLVRHRSGAGQTFYFATHLDIAAFGSPAHHEAFRLLLEQVGLRPPVRLQGPGSERVDPHLLCRGTEHLLILTNENETPVDVSVETPGLRPGNATEAFGLPVQVRSLSPFVAHIPVPAQDAAVLWLR
jgi:beta-galactosidase